jgi:hypothetical protein
MARPDVTDDDKVVETWEITTQGSVWVNVYDRREDRYVKQLVAGRSGSKRLHISRDDRKFNQEQIPDENSSLDPFSNGMLRLVDAATRDENLDVRFHLSATQLVKFFETRDRAEFRIKLESISSELVLRRLNEVADENGTVAQVEELRSLLNKRYPIGGTQRTIKEMLDAGERLGVARV